MNRHRANPMETTLETSIHPAELIVYACPTGELAGQVEQFYAASRERFGANSAHAYPPHITLTGFFHDDRGAIPIYVAALAAAREAALPRLTGDAIAVTELATLEEFHGLLITSPWLENLTADFADRAGSPTRRADLRLKSWLHLSLAYGFRTADGPGLAALARAMVDPNAPAGWELRLYERLPGGGWQVHGAWGL
jgi:ubiquitin-associated SH3 domain-containing protein